jgi:tetratricopeptide (TPR) repeat protein
MREELDRLLPLLREGVGTSAQDLIRALRNNANLQMHEGKYDSARDSAQEALDLSIRKYGERHAETATSWLVLALAHVYAKRSELALDAAGRAYQLTLDLHQGNARHPRAIEARDLYGRALQEAGQPYKALEHLKQAAADAAQVFGPSAMTVGFISQHLSVCQLDVGDIKEALESSRKACSIVGSHAKPDSYIFANQVYTRGLSLLAARRSKEAIAALITAVETFRRTIGPAHSVTFTAEVNRALALGYAGQLDKAGQELEPLLRRIEETKSGPVSLALFAMGVVKRLAGEYEEALRLQQASLDSMQESARSTLAGTRVLTEIGLNQLELGKYDAAESSLARALARFQSLQKRVTPDRADAIQGLGRVRMAQSSRIAKMRRSRHEALEGLRVRAGIN